VVVNGMSFAARRAFWANSAMIVEVRPSDFPEPGPLGGYAFQDAIERAAFEQGGAGESAPAQTVTDFLARRRSQELPRTSYSLGATPSDLRTVLPPFITDGMEQALHAWNEKLDGFSGAEGVLIAPETRTTSPIRFLRDKRCESVGLPGLYPLGEGAGYGGGIVSCALDGLRAARALSVSAAGASGS